MGKNKLSDDGPGTMNGKSDLDRVGLFREMGYVSLKDTYKGNQEKPFCISKFKGKQFQVSSSKIGKTPDTFFDKKFLRVFQGECYTDPRARDRKFRNKELKKNIGKPFKPGSDLGRRIGHGPLHSSFDGPETAMSPLERPRPPAKVLGKNFVTKPGRLGTGYGFVDVTIGKFHEYMSTQYDLAKEMKMHERAKHVKKMVGSPFVSNHYPQPLFDSQIYKPQQGDKALSPKTSPKKNSVPPVAFRPSHPSRSGIQGNFNPYPKIEPEPPQPTQRRLKPLKIFKPPGGMKSTVSRSITLMNVPLNRNVYV